MNVKNIIPIPYFRLLFVLKIVSKPTTPRISWTLKNLFHKKYEDTFSPGAWYIDSSLPWKISNLIFHNLKMSWFPPQY